MLRTLRMMAAAGCLAIGIACSILWYRSFTRCDGTWGAHPYSVIYSVEGLIVIRFTGNPFTDPPCFRELIEHFEVEPIGQDERFAFLEEDEPWRVVKSVLNFDWQEVPRGSGATWINFPHWAPIALSAILGLAFAFKLPIRFGLRGLLIVTTLLAMLLGAGVFLHRR